MSFRLFIAGALALGLSACGSIPTRIPLDSTTKQALNEVKVANIVGQDEIIVRAEAYGASMAMGGGLIGAIIDSKVAESRQNTIQSTLNPFYGSVDDFDFRAELRQSLSAALQQGTPIKIGAVDAVYPSMPADIEARRVALGARAALLELVTAYTFSPDFSRLLVSTSAYMKLPGTDKPSYLNTFHYESTAIGGGGPSSLQAWADKQGEQYRAIARESIAQLIKMLKLDLHADATDSANASTASATLSGPAKVVVTGPVLDAQQGRTILRAANGNLYSTKQ